MEEEFDEMMRELKEIMWCLPDEDISEEIEEYENCLDPNREKC